MTNITVTLIKPAKGRVISYQGEVIERDSSYILLRARWQHPRVDLGHVVFEPGDTLYEYFYTDRWYNVFEVRTTAGTLKGWYCNITRPADFRDDRIESEDLELDLFVPPDRSTPVILDEEEYAARNLQEHDPAAHRAAMAALTELRDLAARSAGPFQTQDASRTR